MATEDDTPEVPDFFTPPPKKPDDDDVLPDSFDMGLLKMPRLTTPQRQSYEAFRKRQRDRASGNGMGLDELDTSAPGPTYLGQDPVEGDPVDLRAMDEAYRSNWDAATPEQLATAEDEYRKAVGGSSDDLPDDFGNLDFLGSGDA